MKGRKRDVEGVRGGRVWGGREAALMCEILKVLLN